MKKLIILSFLIFALFSNALFLTVDNTTRVGQSLGVKMQVVSIPKISDIPCTVYTTSNDKDMLDLYTYDSILNEPAGLKTNTGGFAFINIPITAKYPVDTTFKVYAYCDAVSNSSSFKVLSYTPTDILANMLISVKDNPIAWVIIIIVLGAIIVIIKMLWNAR